MGNSLTTLFDYVRDFFLPQMEMPMPMEMAQMPRARWTRTEDDLQEAFVRGAGPGARTGSLQFWDGLNLPGRTSRAKRDRWARTGGRTQKRLT